MKTERKQELKTNELGAFLLDLNDWTKKYSMQLGVGLVAVLLIVLAVRYFQSSRESANDAAVTTLSQLSFAPEDADDSFSKLDRIINDTGDRSIKMAALIRKGGMAMSLATGQSEFNPEHLDEAESAYSELANSYADRMPVVGNALSSLATVEENLFVVDQDMSHRQKAQEYLTRLRDEPAFKGTPFQTVAAERLQHLDEVFQVVEMAEPPPLPPAPPEDETDASSGDEP